MIKCCLLFVMVLTTILAQDSLEVLIKDIFSRPEDPVDSNEQTNNPDLSPVTEISGTEEVCTCVRYNQCSNNSVININGEGIIDIRIQEGDGKCTSYLKTCCMLSNIIPEKITPAPPIEEKIGCGNRHLEGISFGIIGDENNEAQFGEFPWMVAVLRKDTLEGKSNKSNVYQCGGSLIHPQVVLTGAHCVADKNETFKIRAGEWDTQTKDEPLPHQNRDVKTVIVHPQYYAGALYNDVALLILEQPVELAENIDVVCLPPQDAVIDNAQCFASGWGKKVFGKEGKYQVILKRVDVPIVDRKTCQEKLRATRLGKFFELHRSFICAGGEPGKDACKGDGGSPLVCPIVGQTDRFAQAGIVAWGIGCGEDNVPAVYANVAGFRNWIDEQMTYNNFDIETYQY